MNYNTTKFINDLKAIGIELSDEQLEQFLTYYEMLIEKNKVMNLTAITDFDEVLEKHFEDSLSLIQAVDLEKSQAVIDLGTGAGFPGIPLKIAFPNLQITLADSLNKRILFMEEPKILLRILIIVKNLICAFRVQLQIFLRSVNIVFHL